jgi:hypothetical protein
VITTSDEAIIRSILEDETVIHGFNNGQKLDELYLDRAIYFYNEDIGLMPVVIDGNDAFLNIAIPKQNRGSKALKWSIDVIEYLVNKGYTVRADIDIDHLAAQRYASWAGLVEESITDRTKHYRS